MTDLKHTPGPWWASSQTTFSGIEVGTSPMMEIKIANVHGRNHEEARANATLIENAPEMLAMLIKIRDHEFGFSKGQVDENDLNKLIQKAACSYKA